MSVLLQGVFQRLLARHSPPPAKSSEAKDNREDRRRPTEGSALLEWIDDADAERAQAVHLLDRSNGGLAVRSTLPLDSGWPVLVTLPQGGPLKAVVRHRRRDAGGWILGLQLIRMERRRFDRRPINREVQLAWQGPDGLPRKAVGRVQDVGEGGLRFACKEKIPHRAAIILAIEGWQRGGTVVNVEDEQDFTFYGVQFSGPPVLQRSADFNK